MITVKLFGMTKLLAGNESTLTVALAKGHSVKNLIELVNKRYPKIGELIQKKNSGLGQSGNRPRGYQSPRRG